MVTVLLFPLKTVPSDKVPPQGPVPVKVRVSSAVCALQMVVVPLITPVGLGCTVTTAVPVRSIAREVQ